MSKTFPCLQYPIPTILGCGWKSTFGHGHPLRDSNPLKKKKKNPLHKWNIFFWWFVKGSQFCARRVLYFFNSIMSFVGTGGEYMMLASSNSFVFLSKYFISSTSLPPSESSTITIFGWLVNMRFWDSQYSNLNESFSEGIEFVTWLKNQKERT